jgi:hypothetical protein
LSYKPSKKELAMQGLTFDPGQRRVLLLVYDIHKNKKTVVIQLIPNKSNRRSTVQ